MRSGIVDALTRGGLDVVAHGAALADIRRPTRRAPAAILVGWDAVGPRDLEVLRLIAAGLSNAEIAARRGTSSHGVEQIVQRLILRLSIEKGSTTNPRVQLAKLYYAHGPNAT